MQLCMRSGLCNRLRAWVGIGALADLAGIDFVVHWQSQAQCRCRFANVFAPTSCAVMTSVRDRHKFNTVEIFKDELASKPTCYFAGHVAGRGGEFWQCADKRMRELPLLPQYENKLQAFMSTLPENIVGVHVRRTDFCTHARDKQLWPALNKEADNDVSFLLCADNPRTVEDMKKRYGKRVYWRNQRMDNKSSKKQRCTSESDAAIDLYSLARTKRLIGTMKSSFSEYAARLGNIPIVKI
jgi:hypothetical protein